MASKTGASLAELTTLLCINAYANYLSNLIGGGPSATKRRLDYLTGSEDAGTPMSSCRFPPGDLVMEISTIYDRARDNNRIGYVVSDEYELMYTDQEWDAVKDQYTERPRDRVVRLQLLTTGQPFAWINCSFVRVPDGIRLMTGW